VKMRIWSLEACDMGKYQQEIADMCEVYIEGIDFKSESEFLKIEDDLIKRACLELGCSAVPSHGCLVVNWNSLDGNFYNEVG